MWLLHGRVYGVALGSPPISCSCLCCSQLCWEQAGAAATSFIKVAFSLLGHLRGGRQGGRGGLRHDRLVSGSSIANVVTTGTFTIPLMERVGFTAEKAAGAIEVASSTNGQLPPHHQEPFLMVEYVASLYRGDHTPTSCQPSSPTSPWSIYRCHEAFRPTCRVCRGRKHHAGAKLGSFHLRLAVILKSGVRRHLLRRRLDQGGIRRGSDLAGGLLHAAGLHRTAVVRGTLSGTGAGRPGIGYCLPNPAPPSKSGLYVLLPVVPYWSGARRSERFPGLSAFWASVHRMFIGTQRPALALFRSKGDLATATLPGFGICCMA